MPRDELGSDGRQEPVAGITDTLRILLRRPPLGSAWPGSRSCLKSRGMSSTGLHARKPVTAAILNHLFTFCEPRTPVPWSAGRGNRAMSYRNTRGAARRAGVLPAVCRRSSPRWKSARKPRRSGPACTSSPRRSAISAIFRCARSARWPPPTRSWPRIRASPRRCWRTTASPRRSSPITSTMPRRCGPRVLARLRAGEALALVSDAGTPLVSDPGFKLVEAAAEEGHHRLRRARRVRRAGGADGGGPADGPLLLRGLPAAAQRRRAASGWRR